MLGAASSPRGRPARPDRASGCRAGRCPAGVARSPRAPTHNRPPRPRRSIQSAVESIAVEPAAGHLVVVDRAALGSVASSGPSSRPRGHRVPVSASIALRPVGWPPPGPPRVRRPCFGRRRSGVVAGRLGDADPMPLERDRDANPGPGSGRLVRSIRPPSQRADASCRGDPGPHRRGVARRGRFDPRPSSTMTRSAPPAPLAQADRDGFAPPWRMALLIASPAMP